MTDPTTPPVRIIVEVSAADRDALGDRPFQFATRVHGYVRAAARAAGGEGRTAVEYVDHRDGSPVVMREEADPPGLLVGPSPILGADAAVLRGVLTATPPMLLGAPAASLAQREPSDPVTVIVGLNSETDQPYVDTGDPADVDDDPTAFAATIPAGLWASMSTAEHLWNEALGRIVEIAGFDPDTGRLNDCCDGYRGDYTPGSPASWAVVVPPSDDANTWPAGRVAYPISSRHASRSIAEAAIGRLPATLHIVSGSRFHSVDRSTLEVVETSARPGYWGTCHRCGWNPYEHAAAPDGPPTDG